MLAQRDEVRCEEKLGQVRKVGKTRKLLTHLPLHPCTPAPLSPQSPALLGLGTPSPPCTPVPLLTSAVGRGSWVYLTEVVLEPGVATKQLGKPQLIPSASNQVEQHRW